MNLTITFADTVATFDIDLDAGDFERDVTVKLDGDEKTMTLAAFLDKIGVRLLPPTGPTFYMDIYPDVGGVEPIDGDVYEVVKHNPFPDGSGGRGAGWSCEVRQKI